MLNKIVTKTISDFDQKKQGSSKKIINYMNVREIDLPGGNINNNYGILHSYKIRKKTR